MNNTNPCHIKGCMKPGVWKPILILRPVGWRFRPNHPPAPMDHSGFLCQEHKDMPAHKLVTQEEWLEIKALFQKYGETQPDWESAKIRIVRLETRA